MHEEGPKLARRFLAGRFDAARVVESWVRMAASPFRRRLDDGRGDGWEDVVQEALLEVTRGLREGKVRDLTRLRPWVFRSTANTCLDRLRSRRRWSWAELDEAGLAEPPSALGRLVRGSTVGALLELAARCPEGCRHLWSLILEGLSYREMSERTGLSEGALRVRVLRCRRRARALAQKAEALADVVGPRGDCAEAVTSEASGRQEESGGRENDL